MQIGEGEECFPFGSGLFNQIRLTLQCKEGLVCVPNITGGAGNRCMKALSKKDDLNYCDKDSDCPYDSECQCDDRIGLGVCIPMPASSKKLRKKYLKYYEAAGGSDEELDAKLDLYKTFIDDHYYYYSYYRCENYLTESFAASNVKASVIMTFLVALFAFIF